MSRRRLLLLLLVVTIGAFALRLGMAIRFQGLAAPPDAASNPDQLDYELFGWNTAHGQGYTLASGAATARRPPGTPFALVPPYVTFGHSYAAARTWFCCLSAATCFATGCLAAELFGPLAGVLAAFGLAVYPGHFYYSMHFLSEVPYGLVIALALLCAVKAARSGSWSGALLAGLFFGYAILTRPQVAFAGPLAFLLALAAPRAHRGRRVGQVVLAGLVCAAVVGPWIARNQRVIGKATLSTIGGVTFWGANNPVIASQPKNIGSWMPVDTLIDANHRLDGSEVENDASAWRYGFEYLKSHGADVPRLLAMKIVRHFSPFRSTPNRAVYWSFALGWLATAPLLLIGVFVGWRRVRGELVLLLLPFLSTLVTALVFYGSIRFRDADAPLFLVPAAAAVAAFVPEAWRRRFAPAAATGSSRATSFAD